MTALTWIAVAIVGGLGAVARFLVDVVVVKRFAAWMSFSESLPIATFVINISGAFLLGLLDGLALSGNAMLIAGTAALGAYTTFSTWMLDTHRLADRGEVLYGFLNVLFSVLVGFGAVVLGHYLGTVL